MEEKIIIFPEAQIRAIQSQLDRIETHQKRIVSEAESQILYTGDEVEKILGCSTKTLQNWRNRGVIEFVQLGSVVRYSKEAVKDFITKFSIKPKH